jgi:hypothetical protein
MSAIGKSRNSRRRPPSAVVAAVRREGVQTAAAMTAELEVEQEKDGGWIATIPAGQDPKTF